MKIVLHIYEHLIPTTSSHILYTAREFICQMFYALNTFFHSKLPSRVGFRSLADLLTVSSSAGDALWKPLRQTNVTFWYLNGKPIFSSTLSYGIETNE